MFRLTSLMLLLSVVAVAALVGCPKGQVTTPGSPASPGIRPAASPPLGTSSPTGFPDGPVTPTTPTTPTVQPAPGGGNEFIAVRNARVFFSSGEVKHNGGGCHRLRAVDLGQANAEVSLIDFDRAALRAFLDRNKDKAVSARLVLAIRALEKGPAELQVATLDSAVDWTQGDKDQQPAGRGEVCFAAAQLDVHPWTTPDGKAVGNLRELCFGSGGKVKTLLNPKGATVAEADAGKAVSVELDGKFLDHLARDPNCRGIVVFTQTDGARFSFSSRDKAKLEPRIALTVK